MRQNILIVDDEPHVVQVMKTFFNRAGFDITSAHNGSDGLSAARSERPDVVISDFDMPKMNGREFIEALFADETWQPQLIILVTARTDADLREWVESEPRLGFVEKPASPRSLVRYVQSRLESPLPATA